ncbi:MAG TPA: ATP-binding protein [Clostridium sp.]
MIKSIKSKISLILIVFISLTIVNSFVSINFFDKLQKSIDSIMHSNYDSVVYAQNMNDSLERQDSLELSFIFEDNLEISPEYELNNTNFSEWLNKAKNNITEKGEQEAVDLIEKSYTDYIDNVRTLIDIKKNQGNNEASKYYYSTVFPLFKDVKGNCNTLLDINQKSMMNMKEKSKELVITARYSALGIAGVVLIIGISIISYLLRKIIHPIEDLAIGINKVSEGNYEYTIPLKRGKEINFIFDCFNNMVEKLKEYDRLNLNKILREKQRTEAIIESINSPIIVTDDENKIIMLNKSAERVFDVKEKKIINRQFLDGIREKNVFNMIQEARNSTDEYKAFEEIKLGKNEEKKYYRITISPIWFTQSENLGAVTIMQDITKFKEIDEMKTDFISNVSHEFRTPLTSICMAVGLLLDRNTDINDDEIELLTIIKEDSDKLDNLVSELLDLSKMKSGKIEMEIRDIDINEVISQIKRAFKIQIEEKSVTLSIDTNGIVRKVKGDINKISWVIANLLGNALRYIKTDGTGTIEIKAREVNNKMLVSICDNGEGIAEEYQELIFEKFIQIKDKNGESTGSSGLGLAICKEIIKAHGEEIWVDSTVGEGSSFYFTLKAGEAL